MTAHMRSIFPPLDIYWPPSRQLAPPFPGPLPFASSRDAGPWAQGHVIRPIGSSIVWSHPLFSYCQRGGVSNKPNLGSGQRQDTGPGILWSATGGPDLLVSLQPAKLTKNPQDFTVSNVEYTLNI